MKNKYFTTKRISSIAIMSAIAGLLMLIDFPISFIAPSFYKLDISDLPCLIGTFALGPIAGVIIETLKILIKLVLKPTSTAFVGELSNLLCGIALCVPAGLVYKKHHNKKGAIKGLIVGSISYIFIGALINYFITIPAFVSLYNIPLEAIISMGAEIFPFITSKFSFVCSCVALFNLVKTLIISVLTYLLYKRISPLLKAKE
ncbi:MAG: ECF transporter S component [Erysipelotrichaceae bacterium]|nr:ECF transporter S component [Erysipelotrichaceae bacterium]